MRLYSTAVERVYISTDFFICLLTNCRQDACDPFQFFVTKNCPLTPKTWRLNFRERLRYGHL
ncbi:MAG: hypothetical protein LBP59_15145 [Planctomycetaceae bacterium]|nr:hypothetical protein [Planctomycetaceae bacterium]